VYPEDRHHWFFNYTQAERFLLTMAARFQLSVIELEPYFGRRNQIKANVLAAFFSRPRIYNLYASSIWVVFQKKN
jgi:hypothetical protein